MIGAWLRREAGVERVLGRHDGDGVELCRRLREWSAIPVILLVFLSTFPVVIPFIFIHGAHFALEQDREHQDIERRSLAEPRVDLDVIRRNAGQKRPSTWEC